MKIIARFMGLLVAIVAAFGLGIGTSSAQTHTSVNSAASAKPLTCSYRPYINGTNINIRWTPGGRVIGRAHQFEQVDIYGYENGWALVHFRDRWWTFFIGYVAEQYISYPTCT